MGGKQAPLTAEVELYHHALSSPLSLKDATRNFKAISCCHLNKLLSDPIVDVHIFEAPVTQPQIIHTCAFSLSRQESVRGVLDVVDSYSRDQNGAFLDHTGATLPW